MKGTFSIFQCCYLILLKMLCIYYVQTYISMYTIMFSMVVLSQVRGSVGEGFKELVTGFIVLPPELVRSRTENRNKTFSLVAYWQCST